MQTQHIDPYKNPNQHKGVQYIDNLPKNPTISDDASIRQAYLQHINGNMQQGYKDWSDKIDVVNRDIDAENQQTRDFYNTLDVDKHAKLAADYYSKQGQTEIAMKLTRDQLTYLGKVIEAADLTVDETTVKGYGTKNSVTKASEAELVGDGLQLVSLKNIFAAHNRKFGESLESTMQFANDASQLWGVKTQINNGKLFVQDQFTGEWHDATPGFTNSMFARFGVDALSVIGFGVGKGAALYGKVASSVGVLKGATLGASVGAIDGFTVASANNIVGGRIDTLGMKLLNGVTGDENISMYLDSDQYNNRQYTAGGANLKQQTLDTAIGGAALGFGFGGWNSYQALKNFKSKMSSAATKAIADSDTIKTGAKAQAKKWIDRINPANRADYQEQQLNQLIQVQLEKEGYRQVIEQKGLDATLEQLKAEVGMADVPLPTFKALVEMSNAETANSLISVLKNDEIFSVNTREEHLKLKQNLQAKDRMFVAETMKLAKATDLQFTDNIINPIDNWNKFMNKSLENANRIFDDTPQLINPDYTITLPPDNSVIDMYRAAVKTDTGVTTRFDGPQTHQTIQNRYSVEDIEIGKYTNGYTRLNAALVPQKQAIPLIEATVADAAKMYIEIKMGANKLLKKGFSQQEIDRVSNSLENSLKNIVTKRFPTIDIMQKIDDATTILKQREFAGQLRYDSKSKMSKAYQGYINDNDLTQLATLTDNLIQSIGPDTPDLKFLGNLTGYSPEQLETNMLNRLAITGDLNMDPATIPVENLIKISNWVHTHGPDKFVTPTGKAYATFLQQMEKRFGFLRKFNQMIVINDKGVTINSALSTDPTQSVKVKLNSNFLKHGSRLFGLLFKSDRSNAIARARNLANILSEPLQAKSHEAIIAFAEQGVKNGSMTMGEAQAMIKEFGILVHLQDSLNKLDGAVK